LVSWVLIMINLACAVDAVGFRWPGKSMEDLAKLTQIFWSPPLLALNCQYPFIPRKHYSLRLIWACKKLVDVCNIDVKTNLLNTNFFIFNVHKNKNKKNSKRCWRVVWLYNFHFWLIFFFFFFCLSKHIRMEPHYMKLKLNSTITLLITEATEP
jgi:hypothetical protein